MATLTVNPTSYSVTDKDQDIVEVSFVCDKVLTDVKLSLDNGITYKNKLSMTQTSAIFDIAGVSNNNYNCKLKGHYDKDGTPIPVESVSLSKTSHTFTTEGDSLQLNTTVLPADAANKNVTWRSSNSVVATVVDGYVVARANGVTTITCTTEDGNKTATCNITVSITSEPIYEFNVVNKTYRGAKETIVDIEGVCTYPNVDYFEVSSDDGWIGVANSFVDGKFKLELPSFLTNGTYNNCFMEARRNATDGGSDVVVATSINKFTLIVEDEVEPPPTNIPVISVSLDKTSHVFTDSTTLQLNATVLPSNATNKAITWTSSNTSVATVTNGLVTPKTNGMCQITVTTVDGNKVAMCSVIVEIEEEVIPPPTQDRIGRIVAYNVKPWENANTALYGLDQFKDYNYDSALLCLPVDCSFANNSPFCDVTETQINMVCGKVESLGLKPILKMHTVSLNEDGQGNTDRPQNPATWFANYRILVNRFADIVVKKGYKEFIISNEMHNVMNLASNKAYMTPIIADVKAKGLKVSMSMNTPEVRDNDGFQFYNELDFYCMNTYPQLTNNSIEWARDNFQKLKDGFYTAISAMDIDYGTLFRDMGGSGNLHKDIWITEFGCIPKQKGLLYPAFWGDDVSNPYNEEVQKLWLHSMFDVVEKDQASGRLTNRVKAYTLWDGNSDSDFNPIGNQAEIVLDTYWKDGSTEPPIDPPPTGDNVYFNFNDEKNERLVFDNGCTHSVDTTNKTVTVSSDFSSNYYGYLIWDIGRIREGRRYRLTCKSSSDKTFVRYRVDENKTVEDSFKTSYSIEFTGVNTNDKIVDICFGIRNAGNIGEITSVFSEIELIDLDGDPPPLPSKGYEISVKDYKIIVKQNGVTESYHSASHEPKNLNGNGGIDGYIHVMHERERHYLSLTRGVCNSQITINGMKPFNYTYIDQTFKATWSNRGYAVHNNTLKFTIANRVDRNEHGAVGVTDDRTINPKALTEGLRYYNCALPGYMEITEDSNSVNSVSDMEHSDQWLGVCRLTDGSYFHIHQNVRLLGGFNNSSKMYVQTLVHELGHTTGIWDHSPHRPTIYDYTREHIRCWLEPSDIAGIQDKFPHLTGKSTRMKEPIKTDNECNIAFSYPHYKNEDDMRAKAYRVCEGEYLSVVDKVNVKGYMYKVHEFKCDGKIIQVKIHESFDLKLIESERYRLYLNEFDYLLNPNQTIIEIE